ncbi:hypothetical protein SUDANB121_03782 [Nocardiopsis dassonvillei]|uniref:hypothetical protein n=1 Tax=Nocardiopsis dassonvillei TaxID=2014 RepID=UPI003F564FD3
MNPASIVAWVLFAVVFALTRAFTRDLYADLFGGPGLAATLASFGTATALGLLVLAAVQRFAGRSRPERTGGRPGPPEPREGDRRASGR